MTQKLSMNSECPEPGDYVQLLDKNLIPCENFTYVDQWIEELGRQLFLISDYRGEEMIITRYFELDKYHGRSWQVVITGTV